MNCGFPPHQNGERGPTARTGIDAPAMAGLSTKTGGLPMGTTLHLELTSPGWRRLGRRRLRRRGQHPLAHNCEEREGGAGGRGGGAGRVASRKLALGTENRGDGRGCKALYISLSGEQDPAQPTRLGPCRNGQGPSSRSIDIETSRITHTRAHTRALFN